jgi:hypothetical protein
MLPAGASSSPPLPADELYDELVHRLREDAAAALTALLKVRASAHGPVTAGDVFAYTSSGLWTACVQGFGWPAGYSVEGRPSGAAALCALIERVHRDIEAAGGVAPLHLVEQLVDDAATLAVYRALVREAIAGTVKALDQLDQAAEPAPSAEVMTALEAFAGGG